MTSLWFQPAVPADQTAARATVYRQPVMRADRSLHGYAVSSLLRDPPSYRDEGLDAVTHAAYGAVDLASLAGNNVVFIRATTAMLVGDWPLPDAPGGLVLEVPGHFLDHPRAAGILRRLRADGVGLALADYVPDYLAGGSQQDAMVPLVDFVKIDLARGSQHAEYAVRCAREGRVAVIIERVDSEAAARFCVAQRVGLIQGPLFQRDATPIVREFTVGEVQCLALVALLTADEIDLNRVTQVIGSDPELTMRVLRLVNSSAFGARSRIDSGRRAAVMLGPRLLTTLAMMSLVGARTHTLTGLWYMLTRAVACRSLTGDDVAYTVGLLSAVASQLRVEPAELIARTGVSDDVGNALLTLSGPYGPVLAAVLAYEENDVEGVDATGLAAGDVAAAYLGAVARALGTATALSEVRS